MRELRGVPYLGTESIKQGSDRWGQGVQEEDRDGSQPCDRRRRRSRKLFVGVVLDEDAG
jgi:hypothetical protein